MFPESRIAHFPDYSLFVLTDGDYISSAVLSGTDWAKDTCTISQMFVETVENPLVLDIGANLGTYAVKMGKWLSTKGGDVIAFEPQQMIFYNLCCSIVYNRLSNIHALNIALGDVDGTLKMPTSFGGDGCNYGAVSVDAAINNNRGWNFTGASESVPEVRIQRLDNTPLPRKINFLKLDVEGLEKKVLDGAENTLEDSGWPPMILETWTGSEHKQARDALLSKIRALGYGYTLLPSGECIAQHKSYPVQIDIRVESDGKVFV